MIKNKKINTPLTIECGSKLLDLSTPVVMGILNLTDDSFFDGGKYLKERDALIQTEKMLDSGASIIDIGAYSSRPNAKHINSQLEWQRLEKTLKIINKEFPTIIKSVDTFRSEIARRSVDCGADIINDISSGELDQNMFETIASLKVPYIMMHMKGNPQIMQNNPHYDNGVVNEVMNFFKQKISQLNALGVKDIVVDPGFGFGKSLKHNYQLLNNLDKLQSLELPILVGISRKSMIYKLLDTVPQNALNGTTALHSYSLLKGASILRAHDVKEAMECIKLITFAQNQ